MVAVLLMFYRQAKSVVLLKNHIVLLLSPTTPDSLFQAPTPSHLSVLVMECVDCPIHCVFHSPLQPVIVSLFSDERITFLAEKS